MAATPPDSDPRLATPANGGESTIAPKVALPRGGPSWIVIAIGMVALGLLLFNVLDGRRRAAKAPAVNLGAGDRAATTFLPATPPLYVPPTLPAPLQVTEAPVEPPPPPPPPAPQIIYVPQPTPQPYIQPASPQAPPRVSGGPTLVFDGGGGGEAIAAPVGNDSAASKANPLSGAAALAIAGARTRASVLINPGDTVPQGTLIPAVLETGLDSTRPGLAGARVTRDVSGFDGKKVLIPRGSRLLGEYRSEAQPGQKRALVNWVRLIRPDGVTIAIGSPTSDPLGQGGVSASVDEHFFARFSSAILQSALDIGVNLASRSTNSSVIVALPRAFQGANQPLTQSQEVTPTLKVKPGASITVFVARDLDFTGVESRR